MHGGKKKGPIHLNPANKGKFTAKAKSAGMTDTEFAHKTLLRGNGTSLVKRREAQFALNAKKFKH